MVDFVCHHQYHMATIKAHTAFYLPNTSSSSSMALQPGVGQSLLLFLGFHPEGR
jgi:hypothetical protein